MLFRIIKKINNFIVFINNNYTFYLSTFIILYLLEEYRNLVYIIYMKYKTVFKYLIILLVAYIVYTYISSKNIIDIFNGIVIFTLSLIILIIMYIILNYDYKLKLSYVDIDSLSEETKLKIKNQQKEENQELDKRKEFSKNLLSIIYIHIYSLGLFQLIIIIHYIIQDISQLGTILIYTFPSLIALIITINHIIKIFKK